MSLSGWTYAQLKLWGSGLLLKGRIEGILGDNEQFISATLSLLHRFLLWFKKIWPSISHPPSYGQRIPKSLQLERIEDEFFGGREPCPTHLYIFRT